MSPMTNAITGRAAGAWMRRSRTHVVIIDGTLSTLEPGLETHAGALFKLLAAHRRPDVTVAYHPGVEGLGRKYRKGGARSAKAEMARWARAAVGVGVNEAIRMGYAALASRYRPGDRIFLFGYSRGAYAARSLSGMIHRVGLLRRDAATERRVARAFRLYEGERPQAARDAFRSAHCHETTPIAAICAWDTVRALGLPYPALSRVAPLASAFHDHHLGPHVAAGYHALALDEDRDAFAPVFWNRGPGWRGRLEQMWFPGAHGDIGGAVGGASAARPLANMALVWMLSRAEEDGLRLPDGWRGAFLADAAAPMVGPSAGLGRLFVLRRRRLIGGADGHSVHPSAELRRDFDQRYRPRARGAATEPSNGSVRLDIARGGV